MWQRPSWLTVLVIAIGALVGAETRAEAAANAGHSARLVVSISGLPAGTPPVARIRGPGLSRRVRVRRLVLSNLKPGAYVLTLTKVKIRRDTGRLKRGATASPNPRTTRIRVKAGQAARLSGSYGTIINPGVISVTGRVLTVVGPPGNPDALVFAGRRAFKPRTVLSVAPTADLPRGVLSHVVSVKRAGGRTTAGLRAASVYDVAPVLDFAIPATAVFEGLRRQSASCGPVSGLAPYRRIKHILILRRVEHHPCFGT